MVTNQQRREEAAPEAAPAVTVSPVIHVRRGIREVTRLLLFVRAGGRCEFDGCNEYLLAHPLTLTAGNFAQLAHIVAFREQGPRGKSTIRPAHINDVGNLMLLCPQCHKLADDHPDQYTVPTLEKFKQAHEDRIFHVTGLGPDLKTTVVQLKARIAGQAIAIPVAQVTEAVAPRYPTDAKGYLIDLTSIDAEGRVFTDAACQQIKRRIERLYDPGMDVDETRHISLFALAPIPLLVFLGSQLSNKVPVDLFQRHRDTEKWVWKDTGTSVEYRFTKIREGRGAGNVGLILSLSGSIKPESLPKKINEEFRALRAHACKSRTESHVSAPKRRSYEVQGFVPSRAAHNSAGMRTDRQHPSFSSRARSGRDPLRARTSSES